MDTGQQRNIAGPEPEVSAEPSGPYPLSFAQESFVNYYPQLADPRIQHCSAVLKVGGPTDLELLGRALSLLHERHQVLGARYVVGADGRPQMVCDPSIRTELEVVEDITTDDAVRAVLQQANARRFNLQSGPLARVCLVRTGSRAALLAVVLHHSIADAWSVFVFISELRTIYLALLQGSTPALRPLAIQYTDHVRLLRDWVAGREANQLLQEFRAELQGVREPFYLPVDENLATPPHGVRLAPGGTVSAEVLRELTQRAKEQGVTVFSVCLAAYCLALARWSERSDVFVGIIHTGRARPEQFNLIGSLVELWLLRARLTEPMTFPNALQAVERGRRQARKYQALPYWKIVEQLAQVCGAPYLLGVAFNFISSAAAEKVIKDAAAGSAAWDLEVAEGWLGEAEEDMQPESGLKLYFAVRETQRGLEWTAQYNPQMFRRPAIEALCSEVGAILAGAAEEMRSTPAGAMRTPSAS